MCVDGRTGIHLNEPRLCTLLLLLIFAAGAGWFGSLCVRRQQLTICWEAMLLVHLVMVRNIISCHW
jgi:hypothetical protein